LAVVLVGTEKHLQLSCHLQVIVLFAGQHISKSPFEVNIDKAQGDASKVTAKGPGLEAAGNIANKPTYFDIYTAGNVPLSMTCVFGSLVRTENLILRNLKAWDLKLLAFKFA
jgi:hypothetical protein